MESTELKFALIAEHESEKFRKVYRTKTCETCKKKSPEKDPCCNDVMKSGMGLKGDQGIHVQSMKAIAEAIEAGKPNGKVWVDHKKTYHVCSKGELFTYMVRHSITTRLLGESGEE